MAKKTKVSQGGKKQSTGHKPTGVKKGNTKTVSTNLKKMNFHNKTKTADVDKKFADIRNMVVTEKKGKESKHEAKHKQKTIDQTPLPDVDSAMDSLESLAMPGS